MQRDRKHEAERKLARAAFVYSPACFGFFGFWPHPTTGPLRLEQAVPAPLPLRGNLLNVRRHRAKTEAPVRQVELQYADYAALLACSPAAMRHVTYACSFPPLFAPYRLSLCCCRTQGRLAAAQAACERRVAKFMTPRQLGSSRPR